MREIKFRAWNSRNESMWSPDFFKLRQDDDGYYIVTSTGHGAIRGIELMQYTGLKDKNGVEVYEGDIVRYQYPHKQLKNHQQLCRVIYEDKAAAFLLKTNYFEPQVKYLGDIAKSNRQYDTRTYELCEVIGNIYENPELLT